MATGKTYRRLKRTGIGLLIFVAAFAAYVEIVNRNSKHMTYRQKVLKAIYPVWMWWTKLTGKNTKELSGNTQPAVSFYSLKSVLNNGDTLDFNTLNGKKVMLVNTASNCGYTNQYADLEKLSDQYKEKLVVIAFPANDFKEQEKGSDAEIAEFCKLNYGITFPLMKKAVVVASPEQHPVFRWLTDPKQNGWNSTMPSWNFTKYLVDENGVLVNYFGPSVSPLNGEVEAAINK